METLPHATCDEWADRLADSALPVLRATHDAIEGFREHPDDVDAHMLADVALRDPLMALRVLVNTARRFGSRLATPAQTVTPALVLGGVDPFFRDFTELPVLEERLAGQSAALHGALADVERSHRAARIAAAIAIHRQDEAVETLHQAALLHGFPRLLVWCEAPGLALEMERRQRLDAQLRTADVQREVLGFELDQLAVRLLERWKLPESLRELSYSPHPARMGPRTVALAVRISRHLDSGWSNAALPDDFAELGQVLQLTPVAAASLVRRAVDA